MKLNHNIYIGRFHVTSSPASWWTVNKRSLTSSLCLSTSICSFHRCYLCLPRLHENHLFRNQESVEEFLSVTTVYICNKSTGKYHLYLSKTADLVMVKKHLLTELTKNKERPIIIHGRCLKLNMRYSGCILCYWQFISGNETIILRKYCTTLITSLSVILTTIKMFLFSVFRLLKKPFFLSAS